MNRQRLAMAFGAAAGVAWLGRNLDFDRPPRIDRRVRRMARAEPMNGMRLLLSPLFPIGLPGTYITVAHAASIWLRRRRKHGGPAIVSAAWLGWLVHRAVKLGYQRERPLRPGVRRRTDSYPSGHTTGTTALAFTLGYVLFREGVLSKNRAAAIAIGAPVLMGAHRVIADEHWVTDVVGGWMLGGAIALAVNGATRRPRVRPLRRPTASKTASL